MKSNAKKNLIAELNKLNKQEKQQYEKKKAADNKGTENSDYIYASNGMQVDKIIALEIVDENRITNMEGSLASPNLDYEYADDTDDYQKHHGNNMSSENNRQGKS
eukprot:NODE_619_length_5923_cov_0.480769.p5 type:complete len:105 gc:universal NODE_619_length_5923_cov_0.480769:1772-2086(+)